MSHHDRLRQNAAEGTNAAYWLQIAGMSILGLAVLLSAARTWASGGWLPRGCGVLVFVVVEMFLLPVGALLMVEGWLLSRRVGRHSGSALLGLSNIWNPRSAHLVALATVLTIVLVLAAVRISFPILSRVLQWGRYGFGSPVALDGLSEVSRITTIQFPGRATLLDGEYLGGMSQHLIAKIRIDRADVDRFLEQPPFLGKGSPTRAWDPPQMAERGWDLDAIGSSISAQGTVDAAPEMCAVTISLDDPKAAVVYLYWQSQ